MGLNLIMLGAPGSGKGTQAQCVSQKYKIPQISTGDILRSAVSMGTEMGLKAKSYMEQGKLVPDEVVVGIVKDRLRGSDCLRGFVLDGFPRTVMQAEALAAVLRNMERRLTHVFSIEVDREELIKRLSGRRTCRNCQTMYHLRYNPPKKEGVCDICGGELYQREDDKEETIKARLEIYDDQTAPLVEYYQRRGLLRPIDGVGEVDEIFKRIVQVIGW